MRIRIAMGIQVMSIYSLSSWNSSWIWIGTVDEIPFCFIAHFHHAKTWWSISRNWSHISSSFTTTYHIIAVIVIVVQSDSLVIYLFSISIWWWIHFLRILRIFRIIIIHHTWRLWLFISWIMIKSCDDNAGFLRVSILSLLWVYLVIVQILTLL